MTERKYVLKDTFVDVENGGEGVDTAIRKFDKEFENVIEEANGIDARLVNLRNEFDEMEKIDPDEFARKEEIPSIVAGSGVQVQVTGQKNKISANIPIASSDNPDPGLLSQNDKILLNEWNSNRPGLVNHVENNEIHIPLGGITNQVLTKKSINDFDIEWADPSGGGSGGVLSINGVAGTVQLRGEDLVEVRSDAENKKIVIVGKLPTPIDIGAAPKKHNHEIGEINNLSNILDKLSARSWRPSMSVTKDQVVYPTDPTSPLAFECIQAGTTGTTEPVGIVMQAVADGTAKWGVFDIRLQRPRVGQKTLEDWTGYQTGYRIMNGSKLCLVSELQEKFPSLYNFLDSIPSEHTSHYIVSESEWNSLSTAAGGVGGVKYFCTTSDGYVRLPDERNMYYRGSGIYEVGDYISDSNKNHTHSVDGRILIAEAARSGMNSGIGQGGAYAIVGAVYDTGLGGNTGSNGGSEATPKTLVQLPVIFVGYEEV